MNRRQFCHQLVGSGVLFGSLTSLSDAAPPRTAPVGASRLQWQRSLKAAQKLALQQDKPIMIVFGASWCTYCHKLERETLADKRVVAFIEREFIPVHLDFDKEAKVARILEVERLPCIVILTPEADLLLRSEGFTEAKEFQSTMTSALEKRAEIQQVRASSASR
jgi:thioredoxin-related protein